MAPEVTVYSKPACSQCENTKGLLNELGIEFTEVDIRTDLDKLQEFQAAGYSHMPIVEAGGETWENHQPQKIRALVDFEDDDDIWN